MYNKVPMRLAVTHRDWIKMLIVMMLFFVLGLNRLGTTNAPDSFMDAGKKEGMAREIVLNFEYIYDFSAIKVYLGGKEKRNVSVFAAQDGDWKQIGDTAQLVSVFKWNSLDFNVKTWQVDLLFTDEEVQLGEIVFLDKNSQRILPINASEYPELFDEQEDYTNLPTYYNQTMFDEVYHGRTAYEFLHGLPIYENTHPPLGKLLMSIGIAIFGMNPFGMRFMCLIFGTMMLPIIFLFALRLTGKSSFALFSEVLLTTEFMHYTLSRIATIDIIVAFFVLCMFYCIYAFIQEEKEKYLLLAGIASACGISTKWTALYALLGLAIIIFTWMFLKWKRISITRQNWKEWIRFGAICATCFVILPVCVYVLSYIPFARVYTDKGLIEHAISNSIHMYQYHSSDITIFDHPWSSSWYQWLVNWIPVLDSYTVIGTNRSIVVTMVNPFVSIAGLAAVIHQIYLVGVRKDKTSGFLLVFYLVMLTPWLFIKRTVFIYQYFICTQALILMISNSIYCMKLKNESKTLRRVAFVSVSLFILFYPIISGMEVSGNYVTGFLKWLPRWVS